MHAVCDSIARLGPPAERRGNDECRCGCVDRVRDRPGRPREEEAGAAVGGVVIDVVTEPSAAVASARAARWSPYFPSSCQTIARRRSRRSRTPLGGLSQLAGQTSPSFREQELDGARWYEFWPSHTRSPEPIPSSVRRARAGSLGCRARGCVGPSWGPSTSAVARRAAPVFTQDVSVWTGAVARGSAPMVSPRLGGSLDRPWGLNGASSSNSISVSLRTSPPCSMMRVARMSSTLDEMCVSPG